MSKLPTEVTNPTIQLPVNYDEIGPSERRIVREEYIKIQEGICHHCKSPLFGEFSKEVKAMWIDRSLFPTGFFDHPVHLHHNHKTGMAIGAVHAYCNAVLWQYHGE